MCHVNQKQVALSILVAILCVIECERVEALSINEVDEQLELLSLEKLAYIQSRPENIIAPFSTDGCSGGMSDGWLYLSKLFPSFNKQYGKKPPWESCCVEHDRIYWRGETENGYAKRKQADLELHACVIETGKTLSAELANKYNSSESDVEKSFDVAAELMYRAVRIGGIPCSRLPWRWGYGWPHCPLFMEKNNTDEKQVDDKNNKDEITED